MNDQSQIKSTVQILNLSNNRCRLWRVLRFGALTACFFALAMTLQGAVGDAPNGGTSIATGALAHQTSGTYNTALGLNALFSDTSGGYNTGTGVNALYLNTSGTYNTATGLDALYSNSSGSYNTAFGDYALYRNTTASYSTAAGVNALRNNTTGTSNTACGLDALYANTNGFDNTAMGTSALSNNVSGSENVAIGDEALNNSSAGFYNTAVGASALDFDTAGSYNVALGYFAAVDVTSGSYNVTLGYKAGSNLTTGSNNIDIGNINPKTDSSSDAAGESNTIRIGQKDTQTATFIAGISGSDEGGSNILAVYVNSNGHLGTTPPSSSRRFKKEIKLIDKTSEAILALHPVTFQYKDDPASAAQFGLIAEEVAEVDPDLVLRDKSGQIYSVRYDAVNAMLLNEFLKQHRTVTEQQKIIADQRRAIAELKSILSQQQTTTAEQQQKFDARLAAQESMMRDIQAKLVSNASTPGKTDADAQRLAQK